MIYLENATEHSYSDFVTFINKHFSFDAVIKVVKAKSLYHEGQKYLVRWLDDTLYVAGIWQPDLIISALWHPLIEREGSLNPSQRLRHLQNAWIYDRSLS